MGKRQFLIWLVVLIGLLMDSGKSMALQEEVDGALLKEVPRVWENVDLTLEKNPDKYCPRPEAPLLQNLTGEGWWDLSMEPVESGVVEYRVAPVNAHQGPTWPLKGSGDKGQKSAVSMMEEMQLTPEMREELLKKLVITPPVAPGIREGTLSFPLHLRITDVAYSCRGEFCGWCYHSDPTHGGYKADVRILPNANSGQSIHWRRMYTGREVEETYLISWRRVGPGPNPPARIEERREDSPEASQVLAVPPHELRRIAGGLREKGQGAEGRVCRGGAMLPIEIIRALQPGTPWSPQMVSRLAAKVGECCRNYGGPKGLRHWPGGPSSRKGLELQLVNVEIECKKQGPVQNLSFP